MRLNAIFEQKLGLLFDTTWKPPHIGGVVGYRGNHLATRGLSS